MGAYPILGQTRSDYPTAVPTFWSLDDYLRDYDLGGGNAWTTIIEEVQDVEIDIPATGYAVFLLDYPSDDYAFEIWTGTGKTGTQFTRKDSGALAAEEYALDWDSGAIQFAAADASETVYATYYRIMGVIRAEHVEYLQDNVEAIADALLNGLVHGLKWLPAFGSGNKRLLDFSQLAGIIGSTDWVLYGGDFGGGLDRAIGWRGDGFLHAPVVYPILDGQGEVGSFAGDAKFAAGGFIKINATDHIQTPRIFGLIDLLLQSGSDDIDIDPGSGLVTLDGGIDATLENNQTKTFLFSGGSSPTAHGSVEILKEGTIEITPATGLSVGTPVLSINGFAITTDGAPQSTDVVNRTSIPMERISGDFTQGQGYDQSNSTGATGFAFAAPPLMALIGSRLKIRRVWIEFDTTVAADYISTVKIFQRDADMVGLGVDYLDTEATTWGQGTTGRELEFYEPSGDIIPFRPWGIEIICTNSTANSIKIGTIWVDCDLTGSLVT